MTADRDGLLREAKRLLSDIQANMNTHTDIVDRIDAALAEPAATGDDSRRNAVIVPDAVAKWADSYIENAQSYVLTDNMMLIYNAARFIRSLKRPETEIGHSVEK